MSDRLAFCFGFDSFRCYLVFSHSFCWIFFYILCFNSPGQWQVFIIEFFIVIKVFRFCQ